MRDIGFHMLVLVFVYYIVIYNFVINYGLNELGHMEHSCLTV